MEDLTKQQIILLALLLSFVTSIGTGIITVSLLDQAPERVTQTINKVVERTVENVLPTETTIKETETITRVVVESDDAVISAIETIERGLVRVSNVAGESEKFAAIGAVIDQSGLVVISKNGYVEDFKYTGVYSQGQFGLERDEDLSNDSFVYLRPIVEAEQEVIFSPVSIKKGTPKLGQSIINVGGSTETSVQTGRVAKIITKDVDDKIETIGFEASIISSTLGSLIINYSGELLGYNAQTGSALANKQFTLAEHLIPIEPEVLGEQTEEPPTNNNP